MIGRRRAIQLGVISIYMIKKFVVIDNISKRINVH